MSPIVVPQPPPAGLERALELAGISLVIVGGTEWAVSDPVAAQAIVDAYDPENPPPLPVPASVTNAQARYVLMQMPGDPGPTLFDDIDTALRAGKDGPDLNARIAWQFWEQANEFERSGVLLTTLGLQFGLSEAVLDELFRQAAQVTV